MTFRKYVRHDDWLAPLLGGLFILLLVGFAVAAPSPEIVAQWEFHARMRFPELADRKSKLSQLYVAEVERLKTAEPEFFSTPEWPSVLASRCRERLRAQYLPGTAVVAPPTPMPAVVASTNKDVAFSLRPEFERLGVKVRDQGQRGSCALFGIMGSLDYYSAKAGGPPQLSEQFAGWADSKITGSVTGNSHAFDPTDVIAGLKKSGICSEELMPYKANFTGGPSKAAIEDALKRKDVKLTWIHKWKDGFPLNDADLKEICEVIASARPVACSVDWPAGGVWSKFRQNYTMNASEFPMGGGGHAVTLVGYEKGPQWEGGGRMEFRNSWSDQWGDGGYAWFSFGFLKRHGEEAFIVEGAF